MLKNVLENFQMSEQYWDCLDKMSEVNFSPAETLKHGTGISKVYLKINLFCKLFNIIGNNGHRQHS